MSTHTGSARPLSAEASLRQARREAREQHAMPNILLLVLLLPLNAVLAALGGAQEVLVVFGAAALFAIATTIAVRARCEQPGKPTGDHAAPRPHARR